MSLKKAITAIGRRKSSTARVYLTPVENAEEASIVINNKSLKEYFPLASHQREVLQPLNVTERLGKYNFFIRLAGGGVSGQAGATLLGISRALEKVEPELRPELKKNSFLTRDPRAVERKKPGRHKARKGTQFSKR
jgi:small subunit ribosomal protein S9